MKDVYLRISPYECGKSNYFDCPLYGPMPPKFRANTEDMFGIGTTDNAPNRSMALEYNSRCSLNENAKKLEIQSLCNTCDKCGHKPNPCKSERQYTYHEGRMVPIQPYAPRALIRLTSYNDKETTLVIPDFLKQESEFCGHIRGNYYNYVILTVNPYKCTFDFTNPNNNKLWFDRILRAIAMRDKLVIKR